ncbi:hypothetical protein ACFL59_07250 [Planctomycetota bacterium]
MIPSSTHATSFEPDLYERAVSLLASALAGEARLTPRVSSGPFACFLVKLTHGPFTDFAYYVTHVGLPPLADGDPVCFYPRDYLPDPRGLSVYRDGPVRDLALAHVRRFTALLDRLHRDPEALPATPAQEATSLRT